MLNEIVSIARERGITRLIGGYSRTPRNGMVAEHYRKLEFSPLEGDADDDVSRWMLDLPTFRPSAVPITIAR